MDSSIQVVAAAAPLLLLGGYSFSASFVAFSQFVITWSAGAAVSTAASVQLNGNQLRRLVGAWFTRACTAAQDGKMSLDLAALSLFTPVEAPERLPV